MLSNLNGDLAGQIPVKKEKLLSALPSSPTIILTNSCSPYKELGKAGKGGKGSFYVPNSFKHLTISLKTK